MRKPIPKVVNTDERKLVQKELRDFLRSHPKIQWRELRPTGFEINISTIADSESEEFLKIISKLNNKN